jgi:hypothetical protein
MKIKLRRDWQGQDSWGAFVEEVGIIENGGVTGLRYRQSTGGNCNYGKYQEWEDEAKALNFLLGPIKVTNTLRKNLIDALSQLPDLNELDMPNGDGNINYGNY